jgi:hypothetical protein
MLQRSRPHWEARWQTRMGKKPILLAASAAILCFSAVYAQATQL